MNPTAWVIVPSYDCVEYLPACLASIRAQDYQPLRVVVIDDATPNDEQAGIVRAVNQIDGWVGIVNTVNVGATANIYDAVHNIAEPDPMDVVIIVDGDDRLNGSEAVSKIMDAYAADEHCWLAFGSYVSEPHRDDCPVALPYPTEVVRERSFRNHSTNFNHPLSFRAFVLAQITPDDLQLRDGRWVPHIYDEAFMYPALELVGPNHRYMPETLYVYHGDTGGNCTADPAKVADIEKAALELRDRPPKPRMYYSDGALTLHWHDRVDVIAGYMMRHDLGWFIETGTGYGDTCERLADVCPRLERIVTIEAKHDRYLAATERLVSQPKVQTVHGDSAVVLRDIAHGIPSSVWWLDAHRDDWWRGDPATVTPIMDELYLILTRPGVGRDVVLIDDARLFGSAPGYPTIDAVRSQVANLGVATGHAYDVEVAYDIVRITPTEVDL